eukprot:CAMPEP_0194139148 /NCGR_PEP_ID=MMETSP0152-20130528/8878_1 /TAXON_ID=1049557 /ORGANISM="Thalassiothrix antarctica, Strain L6-D1" /LENGTH=401 /DNA_ID=CAMNT_0038836911 /DNA_START=163 /DNA_END=1368 /DNA_ORIENTATION=-
MSAKDNRLASKAKNRRRSLATTAMASMHNKRTKETREAEAKGETGPLIPPRKECPPDKQGLPPLSQLVPQKQDREYKLADQAEYWCHPSERAPLNYNDCNHNDTYYQIPFMAGLTNGLKMMLLAVIRAFEENRCLYVTEWNHLMMRTDKTQELKSFIGRYFEPIGLPLDNENVLEARKKGRVEVSHWMKNWDDRVKRRMHGLLHNITSLGYENMESTLLKRIMLQRMWRLQPAVREESCKSLESKGGLDEEYMAFSVRRGDKDTEGFEFTKSIDYIIAAEDVSIEHFNCHMPTIFVATDDCAVMDEFRTMRPEWNFVSECENSDGHNGFILSDMKTWTLEQTDEHYRKFFVELIGLAGAKFFIGVTYTNVAWWAAYMRPHRWSHKFLDKPGQSAIHTLDVW